MRPPFLEWAFAGNLLSIVLNGHKVYMGVSEIGDPNIVP